MSKLLGGRKATAFYTALMAVIALAYTGKASTEVLSAIDGLVLLYLGSNVAHRKVSTPTKQEQK